MESEEINIPIITLRWTKWIPWKSLEIDMRYGEGVRVPDESGVYEAKYIDEESRLTIGKASNLRMRVKQGMVKGKTDHSAGEKIRAHEDVSKIVVRWALTDRPAATEEELHKRHQAKFGSLPKYTEHT